jgi:hypothetical protein
MLVLAIVSTARGETTIKEYPDRVVVEVTGAPLSPEEQAARDRQLQKSEAESSLERLATERDELARGNAPDGSTEPVLERRARMVEKRREMERMEDGLKELNHQAGNPGKNPAQ